MLADANGKPTLLRRGSSVTPFNVNAYTYTAADTALSGATLGATHTHTQKAGSAPVSRVSRHFVAFWKDLLTATPVTFEVDVGVCSIALGATDGPDKVRHT
jgi:hypothetical protein